MMVVVDLAVAAGVAEVVVVAAVAMVMKVTVMTQFARCVGIASGYGLRH